MLLHFEMEEVSFIATRKISGNWINNGYLPFNESAAKVLVQYQIHVSLVIIYCFWFVLSLPNVTITEL